MNKYKQLIQRLPEYFTQTVTQHWLDLGCGQGVFTEVLASLLPSQSDIIAVCR
jgi:hypothetical protein